MDADAFHRTEDRQATGLSAWAGQIPMVMTLHRTLLSLFALMLTGTAVRTHCPLWWTTGREVPGTPGVATVYAIMPGPTPAWFGARMGEFRAQGAALAGTVDGMLRIVQQGDWDEQLRQAVVGLELSELNRLVWEAASALTGAAGADIQGIIRDISSVAGSLRNGDPVRALFTASDRVGYNSPEIAAQFLCTVVTKARAAARTPVTGPARLLPQGKADPFHHIFPQRADLAAEFSKRGVDIDEFTMQLPGELHIDIHRGAARGGRWNKAWEDWGQPSI